MNDILLSDISPDGPAGTDGKFSLTELQNTLLGNRSMTAELLLDDLVTACIALNEVKIGNEVVNLSKACETLAGYNKHLDLDSNGAILFREWITHYSFPDLMNAGTLFTVPFDPDDPVNTPRNLADKEKAIHNLGLAVQVMKREGLALDSSLGDTQFAYRGGQKVALHGGNDTEGVANIIGQWMYDTMAKQIRGTTVEGSSGLTEKGYPILGGTSYLLGLSFTDDGPVAEAVMTYGQSGDPTSEHYKDQLKLFNKKQWRPVLYKMKDVNQNIISSIMLTEGVIKGN
jgi:acyl-homoserine-lactone acylase